MYEIFLTMNKNKGMIFGLVLNKSNRDGLVAAYLVCTKPSSPTFERKPLTTS